MPKEIVEPNLTPPEKKEADSFRADWFHGLNKFELKVAGKKVKTIKRG